MAITAVSVEANGWVLAVTLTAGLSSPNTDFSGYTFDPSGAPRMTLNTSHAGFVKSAGTAISGSITRAVVATRPLRLPVNVNSPLVVVIDETDLGGGSIMVRLALAENIYATDTGLTLDVLAGWRTGESAASGIAVTNNSTIAAPVPIFRWVLPSYDVASGSFRVSLLVASHHPVDFDPVAGVKFTATDGTNTQTVWATALATDDTYGDALRCFTVMIDPSTATALTAGLLRVDAEVYPYLGSMRSTDTAGTRSMTNLRLDGVATKAESPWVIGYDPAGTRYSNQFAFIDPVNGSATAAVGMIATSRAAAKAITATSRPKDVMTAIQAASLTLRTQAAANGQASAIKSIDGLTITMAAGTHPGLGTTAVGSTTSSTEIPVTIEGDPTDADPRNNCIFATQATGSANTRATRIRWRNLTILAGGAALNGSTTAYNFLDNIEVRGRTGDEALTTTPIGVSTTVAGYVGWWITRSKFWKYGLQLGGANRMVGLLRASQHSRRAPGITLVKNTWITKAVDGFTASNIGEGWAILQTSTDLGALEDVMLAYNDGRGLAYAGWLVNPAPAALAGTTLPSHRRTVILNNVFERISGSSDTTAGMWGYGETSNVEMTDLIVEGNTVAGTGYNSFYNDPVPATVSDTNTQNNTATRIRHANNATDRNASKHDDFSDPSTASVRAAAGVTPANGYRPVALGAWGPHFGVGMEGHVDCSRSGTIANFRREFSGLRGVQYDTPTAPGWTLDSSVNGSDGGGGNYTPAAGSVFLGRVMRGNSDVDIAGNTRRSSGTSGAYEANDANLAPEAARQAHRLGSSILGVVLPIGPVATLHRQRYESGAIVLLLPTAPLAARNTHGATGSIIAWTTTLATAAALMSTSAVTSAASAIEATDTATLLCPWDARLSLISDMALLLPDDAAAALLTLKVRADPRILFVN
jgi:hypothetical protein